MSFITPQLFSKTLVFCFCLITIMSSINTSTNSYIKIKRYKVEGGKKIGEKNYLKYFKDKICKGFNKIKNFLKGKIKKNPKPTKKDDFDNFINTEIPNGNYQVITSNDKDFEKFKKMFEQQQYNMDHAKHNKFQFNKPQYQQPDFDNNAAKKSPKNVHGNSNGTEYVKGKGSKWEKAVNAAGLQYLNEFRNKNGLPSLEWDDIVFKYARPHTEVMVKKQKISHDGFDRRFDQINNHIDVFNSAENVAYFNTYEDVTAEETARRLTDQWIKSPGHRKNMLLRDITHVAVSILRNDQSGAYYGTQFFIKK